MGTWPTLRPNAPECLRQREQWQWIARVNGSVTSNRTPPQRQLPPTVSAMPRVYVGSRGAASVDGEARSRRALGRGPDRLLRNPLSQVARLARYGRVLPLLLGAAVPVGARDLGGRPARPASTNGAPRGLARGRVLRR